MHLSIVSGTVGKAGRPRENDVLEKILANSVSWVNIACQISGPRD